MMARLNQFFGRMGLATLRLSPNRNAGGGGGGGGEDLPHFTIIF